MRTFVFTADTIQRFSEHVTQSFDQIQFVISEQVCDQLIRQNEETRYRWLNWSRRIKMNSSVSVDKALALHLDDVSKLKRVQVLNQSNGMELFLVTDNSWLQAMCSQNQIKVISCAELSELLKNTELKPAHVDDLTFNVILSLGLLAVIAGFYSIIGLELLNSNIERILFYSVLIIFGFFLYSIRQRFRLGYSIVEILLGIATICFSDKDGLRISGGLYLMVRGLDNMSTALKKMNNVKYYAKFTRLLFVNE